jgi:hypothetical protein
LLVCVLVPLQSQQVLTFSMSLARPEMLLSDCIEALSQPTADDHDTAPVTVEERSLRRLATLVAVNACLLLAQYGCWRLGTTNDRLAERLQRQIARHNKHEKANRRQLRTLPQVYGFDQHITVFEEEKVPSERRQGNGGWAVGPHWRRGHWRRLPGYREAEARGETAGRVFVRPVLVNAHLLVGPASATRVSLQTARGSEGE